MNLSEERNYQKLLDTLDALNLSAKNRQLAEQYLNLEEPEQPELLKQVEQQNFADLDHKAREKSKNYVDHVKKRERKEELGRYVRFVAAAGGSTAQYVLVTYTSSLNILEEFLTVEQTAAMRAENLAWNKWALNFRSLKTLFEEEKQNPGVLARASRLCYHKFDNAQVLLTGISLYYQKPAEKNGLLKGLFGKTTAGATKETQGQIQFLLDNLVDSMPAIFTGPKPTDEEMKLLGTFIRNSDANTPFPKEFLTILQGKTASEYLLTLLAGSGFLAFEHSPGFLGFLRVMAALNPEFTLNACKNISQADWFAKHLELLENTLPMDPDVYVKWCLASHEEKGLSRMAARYPEVIKTVAENTTTEDYAFLLEQVKAGNPSLFQKMNASFSGDYEAKLANEIVGNVTDGQAEARAYLLGEGTLESLYPFVNSWRGGYYYNYKRMQKLEKLEKSKSPMFRRGIMLDILGMKGGYFTGTYFSKMGPDKDEYQKIHMEEVDALVELMEEEHLPVRYQADGLEAIYDNIYQEERKAIFMDAAVAALSKRQHKHVEELRDAVKTSTAVARGICIRVLDNFWQEEKETILACAMDSSKQVKEVLAGILAGHKEWEPEVRALLVSKKSQERELAILTMKKWGVGSYQEELAKALETEKSKKLKDLLQGCLGVDASAAGEAQELTTQELVTDLLKGGKKRKAAWAYETPFSEVHKKDGTLAGEDYMQALLVAYADKTVPGISIEAERLASELAEKELHHFMSELFDKWLESGAEAKKKWVLYAASIHGGAEIVPVFWKQIQEWPNHARGAMAAEAVKALALNGSSQALLQVDQISRKFKFRQVKAAAAEALEHAAAVLGISRAELEDRIVPNLGFDETLKRIFDYGTRSFSVYLTPALELEIFDEDEKKLKNLPAPGKRDEEETAAAAYAEFKQLKKQLKTVVANQKLRLEQALTAERLWTTEKWQELFVKNPVMHQFAIGLIWGVYEDGTLKDTFRYMEDGSFNTRDEDELELPENGTIGLVHPIELDAESLNIWKEQLSDYEITQPIEQLERVVFRVTEEEKEAFELTRFGGKILNGLSLSGKLQGQGWYRGSVQDAGCYYTFYREDGAIGIELEFSGCYVGDENEDVTVYGATFYKSGTVKRGSYIYDTIKEENRYALGEVPARYFSEMVVQLQKATASSKEQLAYPDCRNN